MLQMQRELKAPSKYKVSVVYLVKYRVLLIFKGLTLINFTKLFYK